METNLRDRDDCVAAKGDPLHAAAQTVQTTQPVAPKHHSILAGAAAGAAAGSAIPGHRHPILGAVVGAEVQHHRNKMAKRAARAQAQQAQQATPAVP